MNDEIDPEVVMESIKAAAHLLINEPVKADEHPFRIAFVAIAPPSGPERVAPVMGVLYDREHGLMRIESMGLLSIEETQDAAQDVLLRLLLGRHVQTLLTDLGFSRDAEGEVWIPAPEPEDARSPVDQQWH